MPYGTFGPRALVRAAMCAVAWLICFEVGVRIDDWARYRTPVLSPFYSQAQLMVRDRDGVHGRPHARFKKWVLNNVGMRGPDVAEAKAAGTFRAIAIGASETFGLYESAGKEYPRQLEDTLEAMRRDGRCRCAVVRRFEVVNGALLGMGLPTVVQDVQNRIGRFAPDMILLYPSPVQYLDEFAPVAARPDSTQNAGAPIPLREYLHPRIVERLRDQVKQALPAVVMDQLRRASAKKSIAGRDSAWLFRTIPDDRINLFEADLGRALDAIVAVGATPVLISHANMFRPGVPEDQSALTAWQRFYPRAAGRVLIAFDSAASARSSVVASRKSVTFLDWHAVAQRDTSPSFADFVHFNDRGSAMLASEVARIIVRTVDGDRSR